MKIKNQTLAFALLAAALPVFAASDGVLEEVQSVGAYTNTFGSTVPNGRKVQIVGLTDVVILNDTPSLPYIGNAAYRGKQDKFCVIDTAGGTVRVRFDPTIQDDAFYAWTPTRERLRFYLSVGLGDAAPNPVYIHDSVDVIAGAKDRDKCDTGNISKSIHIAETIPANKRYTETIIVTAIPK